MAAGTAEQPIDVDGICNDYEQALVDRCYAQLLPRWARVVEDGNVLER
jgi:predicted kinase